MMARSRTFASNGNQVAKVTGAEQIGAEIKRVRKLRKLTQIQLAERMGIKQGYVSVVEAGAVNLTLAAIQAFAEALDHDLVIQLKPKK